MEGTDYPVLRALRLKGLAAAEALAGAIGWDPDDVAPVLAGAAAAGLVEETKRGFRLTADGKAAVERAVADERAGLDVGALEALYDAFCAVNDDFKQLMHDWQLRPGPDGEPAPNDHTDAAYDGAVLARLDGIHERVRPVVAGAAAALPRLGVYDDRFAAALDRVRAGEARWLAAPLIDSYHTVWFELHEELIVASGRNRADEAAAGRGA